MAFQTFMAKNKRTGIEKKKKHVSIVCVDMCQNNGHDGRVWGRNKKCGSSHVVNEGIKTSTYRPATH